MLIDYQAIKRDIQTDKSALFIQEFPDVKDAIEQFKAKPTCGSCEQNVIPKLMANPKLTEKLKLIYGEDIQVDLKVPERPQFDQAGKTFMIKLEEYEKWFEDFNKPNPDMVPRMFSTCYIAHLNSILVSVNMMVRRK